MKRFLQFSANSILTIVGVLAFFVVIGEPNPEASMSMGEMILYKGLGLIVVTACVKLAVAINPELGEETESEKV